MRQTSSKFLVLVTCNFILVVSALTQPRLADDNVAKSCIPRERDALLAFKQGITNDTSNMLASWRRGQDCCQWRGVTCSNRSGHVVKLDLPGSLFSAQQYYLVGQISPFLLSLEYLEYLDLSWNALTGPNDSIPQFLGSMKNLRHLDLSYMTFSGRLPSFLGNLSNLEYLDLSYTSLSGSIPPQLGNLSSLQHLGLYLMQNLYPTDISWLSHLHSLEYLDMSFVNLSTAVDWAHVLNAVPSLEVLYLEDCLLPRTSHLSLAHLNFTKLKHLDLSLNYIIHPIASCWFWNVTTIESLVLFETYLYGPFPSSLGSMTSLKLLDFSNNGNTATIVDMRDLCALEYLSLGQSLSPGNITDLVEKLPQCPSNTLRHLILNDNSMIGNLPNRIGHLTSLITLDLSYNIITGAIPLVVQNLTSLSFLDISYNNLSGAVPQEIGNITSLQTLDLSNNHLTGAIPLVIGYLSRLQHLDLSGNSLRHVPSVISKMSNLTTLDLSYNNLDGVITEKHFDSLNTIAYINLSHNFLLKILVSPEWFPPFRLKEARFSFCQMGPLFPSWLKFLEGIEVLDISSTGITGKLPDWFFKTFRGAQNLDFSNNQISGTLPSNMAAMSLKKLYANSNQLTGQMPLLPRGILKWDVSQNSLSGHMPLDFRTPNIIEFILSSNNFTGHVPESICDLQGLLVLDLSNNTFYGELPQCFRMPNITFLLLSNNNFSGKFPLPLQSCSSLAFLDLSWNKFSGSLPIWIGDLVYLRFLQLSHNMFNGDIPPTITSLKVLQHLSLAGNSLSGAIPASVSSLRAMTQKVPVETMDDILWHIRQVRPFKDVLSVVMKRQELKYGETISEIVGIDFSQNHLTGGIPDQISSLTGLLNLNLSWNYLTGKIPEKIGDMKSMESLDLSRNKLYGEIPPSLSDLTYLSYMDLSYNNLTGPIPSGRQLDTLYTGNPSMYDGNSGLCGPPLRRNCSGGISTDSGNQNTSETDSEAQFFYFGLGSGFTVGLWVMFCVLLFNKTWRISYYRLFDKAYDRVYLFVVVAWGRLAKQAAAE